MKYYLKVIILLSLFTSSLFSLEDVESKELYLEYNSYPQRVFTGQKFDIEFKALILNNINSYDKIVTSFSKEENIEVVTPDIIWTKNNSNEYLTTVSYKIYQEEFILPTIKLSLYKNGEIVDFITINSPEIQYQEIAVNQKLFSKIIAQKLEIFTVKTKQYNNNILHTTINIKATKGNLEDFVLSSYDENQGIDSLTDIYPMQNLYYYVMIPSHTKEIKFTYYNTDSKSFVTMNVPIILDEELVSTQTELNPYNSSLLIYKQVASGSFVFIFLLLFILKRKNIYLIFLFLSIAILSLLFIPNKKILLKENINVYILPSNNSTVFKSLKSKEIVEIVNEKKKFMKVLFKNQSIGWVKKDDI